MQKNSKEENENPVYLNERQVSEMTSLSLSTLRAWRFHRKHLPYHKLPSGKILYCHAEIIEWMKSHQVKPVA